MLIVAGISCRYALFFVLIQRTKDQVSREAAFATQAFSAKRTEPGRKVLRLCFAATSHPVRKTLQCPPTAYTQHCSARFRAKRTLLTSRKIL